MLGEHFLYQPLHQCHRHTCIRLLHLHPAENLDLPLLGQLMQFPLHSEEIGSFEALSYTWADACTSQRITLNGKTFDIRQNLYEALRRLRLPDRPRQLWVDAICINQADSAEKSKQVPLMGQIYATAKRVIAWLGEGSSPENDCKAYELFLWASPHRTLHPWRESSGPWNLPPLPTILRTFNDLKAHDALDTLSTTHNVTLEDIEQFLKRPWFSRRWIVQELCNARDIILVFGRYELSWRDFSGALDTLAMASEDSRSLQKYPANRLMIWRNGVMIDSVLEGMEAFHDFAGSDNRDRIAAFLTLRWPQTSLGSDFVLDYSQSVDDNYYRLAVHMVNIGKGADVLITASNCHRDIGAGQGLLPSWVPDWRTITRRKIRSRIHGTFDMRITHGNCLEFSGQISYVLATDAEKIAAGNSTMVKDSRSQILPKKDDIICRLITKEGNLDLNGVVLRRYKQSDRYFLVTADSVFYDWADADWADCVSVPEQAGQPRHFLVK